MAIHLGRRSYGNIAFSRTAPPDAFDVADWALGQGSNFTLDIFIFNLPDFNGFPITQLEYRLNGGAAIPLNSTALGVYNISGLDEDVAYDVEIRAVNGKGAGDWSDVKTETTAGFTPLTLFSNGEQGVWYDPSDLSTMFQDTDGTTPVTAAGQAVALLLDKSGRGNHATQAITAAREGTAAYGFNRAAGNYDIGGRGGLYFPGTAIVGQVIRNGAMTQTQQDDAIAWLRSKGGGLSYGAVTDFSNFFGLI
jgi:hypothetical protein